MALSTILYKQHTFNISYEIVNPQSKIDFIVLHGWGSNKNLMKQSFATELNHFRHLYVDLPGFGNSTTGMKLDSEDYASILELFLAKISFSKTIILGHSFGGKVALLLNPEVLILVSSAGILVPKPFSVKAKIAVSKLFKSSKLTNFLKAKDADALTPQMYETFKTVIAEDMEEKFSDYNGKTVLYWGEDDTATPLWTANKIVELSKNAKLTVYQGDHYFFLQQASRMKKEIEAEIIQYLETL